MSNRDGRIEITEAERERLVQRVIDLLFAANVPMSSEGIGRAAGAWVRNVERYPYQVLDVALGRLEHGPLRRDLSADDWREHVMAVLGERRSAEEERARAEAAAKQGPPATRAEIDQVMAEIRAKLGDVSFGGRGYGSN